MQGDTEQAALRSVVDGEIERRAMQNTIDDTLYFAGRFFQNEKIVWANEGEAGRLVETGDHSADSQIVVQHRRRRRRWLNERRRGSSVVSRIGVGFIAG